MMLVKESSPVKGSSLVEFLLETRPQKEYQNLRNRRHRYKHNLKISRKPRKFKDKWGNSAPTIVFLRNKTELVIISELVPRTGVDQWPIENRVYQKVWPQKWESRFLQIFLVRTAAKLDYTNPEYSVPHIRWTYLRHFVLIFLFSDMYVFWAIVKLVKLCVVNSLIALS